MKTLNLIVLVLVCLAVVGGPALAQTSEDVQRIQAGVPKGNVLLSGAGIGAGIGAALVLMGAGYGFGKIGSAALESMARQPEVANQIQTAMIIIGALLEGATFFALIVCILLLGKATF